MKILCADSLISSCYCSCNEVGWNQDGAPQNEPTLISRLLAPSYEEVCEWPKHSLYLGLTLKQRQCGYFFPEKFGTTVPRPDVDFVNSAWKGWNISVDHLFFANGKSQSHCPCHQNLHSCSPPLAGDPWRDATVSADGSIAVSTALQPIAVSDGFHACDLITANAVDESVLAVQKQSLASMKEWLPPIPSNNQRRLSIHIEKDRM